ncbi:MAG: hypothetical protein IT318_20250 [Anaerolineales bacterium]|nr:hypothetical protein [Anaerolineales bacterium]
MQMNNMKGTWSFEAITRSPTLEEVIEMMLREEEDARQRHLHSMVAPWEPVPSREVPPHEHRWVTEVVSERGGDGVLEFFVNAFPFHDHQRFPVVDADAVFCAYPRCEARPE